MHPCSGSMDPSPEGLWRAGGTAHPTTSTDNALARYDGTSGALQDSGWTLDDSDDMAAGGDLDVGTNAVTFEADQATTLSATAANILKLVVGGTDTVLFQAGIIDSTSGSGSFRCGGRHVAGRSGNSVLHGTHSGWTAQDFYIEGAVVFALGALDHTVHRGLSIKKFTDTVTLDTGDAETAVGLTPSATIISAAIRVSTQITGLDSADHHIQLGINGSGDKYIDVAQGGASTTIDVNKKGNYVFDPDTGPEAAALVFTITEGGDQTPTAGAVEVEVIYFDSNDLADV